MHRNVLAIAVVLVTAASGCFPAVTYIPIKTALPPRPDSSAVEVYREEREIPAGATTLGEIRVGDTGFSVGCDFESVMEIVKAKAREIGADAVHLQRIRTPSFDSTCYWVQASLLALPKARTADEQTRSEAAEGWRRPRPPAGLVLLLRDEQQKANPALSALERAAAAVLEIRSAEGSGTAFVLTKEGLALTNHHVVRAGGPLKAVTSSGETRRVRVLRSDADSDVALLEVDCETECFTVAPSPTPARVGDEVYVVGNPLALSGTVSRGIVSGLRFDSRVSLVQTDAAISPGNSGGPMISAKTGEVIGMVSWKVAGRNIEGIGFAVSILDALRVVGVQSAR